MAQQTEQSQDQTEQARIKWDRAAQAYAHQHETSPSFQHLLWPELKKVIDRTPMQTALDAGCGNGELTGYLASKGIAATGVDFSEPMLAIARKNIPDANFVQGDLAKLDQSSLRHQFFDAVLCVNVLITQQNYQTATKQMANRINPGGHLVIAQLHPARTARQTNAGYFEESSYSTHFIDPNLPTGRWHRPFSSYFNCCSQLGLDCVGIRELCVNQRVAPPDLHEWSKRQTHPQDPVFIIFDWKKPKREMS